MHALFLAAPQSAVQAALGAMDGLSPNEAWDLAERALEELFFDAANGAEGTASGLSRAQRSALEGLLGAENFWCNPDPHAIVPGAASVLRQFNLPDTRAGLRKFLGQS